MRNLLISLSLFLQPNSNLIDTEKMYYEQMVYQFAPRGVKKSFNSSVMISSLNSEGQPSRGSGNLFRIAGENVIITAAHVIEGGIFTVAVEKNENLLAVEVVYVDTEKDIAVLKLMGKPKVTTPTNLRLSAHNKIGKEVYTCGHPSVVVFNVSRGMITSLMGDQIVVDAFSLPGSSGSVVFTKEGAVVGVVVAVGIHETLGTPELVEEAVRVSLLDYLDIQGIVEALENGTTRIEGGDNNN